NYLRDFRYRVVRLKYFIIVVTALMLEIITLIIYLLKNENFVDLNMFTASVLYGAISAIIVILAIGCLVLIRLDKRSDKNNIKLLLEFKRKYYNLLNKYSDNINEDLKNFDRETKDLEVKINYAESLSEKYGRFLKEFEEFGIPNFLSDIFKHESNHIQLEKQFYESFSSLSSREVLQKISAESETAHRTFLNELNSLEKNLKLII
ncbi:MAG: hypothetical protein JW770_02320, partial [Actinobacteria bacterium]|nr:hypothetical protein [Actinomycetota bacterium]